MHLWPKSKIQGIQWSARATMILTVLKGKLHAATVTEAELHYMGSITIDEALMDEVGLIEHEQVHIYNITNGQRFVTYTLRGPKNSGVICINGAAARLASPGDKVIIAAYAQMDETEARNYHPRVLVLGDKNQVPSV